MPKTRLTKKGVQVQIYHAAKPPSNATKRLQRKLRPLVRKAKNLYEGNVHHLPSDMTIPVSTQSLLDTCAHIAHEWSLFSPVEECLVVSVEQAALQRTANVVQHEVDMEEACKGEECLSCGERGSVKRVECHQPSASLMEYCHVLCKKCEKGEYNEKNKKVVSGVCVYCGCGEPHSAGPTRAV